MYRTPHTGAAGLCSGNSMGNGDFMGREQEKDKQRSAEDYEGTNKSSRHNGSRRQFRTLVKGGLWGAGREKKPRRWGKRGFRGHWALQGLGSKPKAKIDIQESTSPSAKAVSLQQGW